MAWNWQRQRDEMYEVEEELRKARDQYQSLPEGDEKQQLVDLLIKLEKRLRYLADDVKAA